jgi:hypothetical protein
MEAVEAEGVTGGCEESREKFFLFKKPKLDS